MASEKCAQCGRELEWDPYAAGEHGDGRMVCPDHGEDCVWRPCPKYADPIIQDRLTDHPTRNCGLLLRLLGHPRDFQWFRPVDPKTCATCPIPAKDELIAALGSVNAKGEVVVPDVAGAVEALRLGVKSQLYSDACDDALRALTGGSDA